MGRGFHLAAQGLCLVEGLLWAGALGAWMNSRGSGVQGAIAGCESMGCDSPSIREVISHPTCPQDRAVGPDKFIPGMLPGHAVRVALRKCVPSSSVCKCCAFLYSI